MKSLLATLLLLALQPLHSHRPSATRLFHSVGSGAQHAVAPALSTAARGPLKKFFIETHGCQMNLADSDVVRSVLLSAGYEMGDVLETSDLILTNTCAIREGSEAKIHQRLKYFNSLKKKQRKAGKAGPMIGVLGCMAERLKDELFEEDGVDFIAGPDNYRDLPRIISFVSSTDQQESNTQLSLDETYSDISPVRLAEGKTHAFVTIQRGCSNHCAFCVVPYVRGVERSRPVESILAEIRQLSADGCKEVVLLGQNVNSYNDLNSTSTLPAPPSSYSTAEGFQQRSRPRATSSGGGVRFAELLLRAAAVDPEMRIRFQSPHPKDFPDEVLLAIADTPNICKALHMPAQHGSSAVLERMKRGYSREAYLSLVRRARQLLGRDMGVSTDLISGFSGETEEEHRESLQLISEVGYDQAFTYSYSRREQTFAGLFYEDDVPGDVKSRRLSEIIDLFQATAEANNNRLERGALHVVLVEGEGRKGGDTWTGRSDSNKRILFADTPVLAAPPSLEELLALRDMAVGEADAADADAYAARLREAVERLRGAATPLAVGRVGRGDYVIVKVLYGKGHTLRGAAVARTSLREGAALFGAMREQASGMTDDVVNK